MRAVDLFCGVGGLSKGLADVPGRCPDGEVHRVSPAKRGPYPMRAVDLFCGVGGLSKGLLAAKFDIIASYDNWPIAINTYTRNMPHSAQHMDLLDVDAAVEEITPHKPEIIVGGPPCQDFSTAGLRTEGNRANLTVAYASIVSRVKPRFALMENVPQARLSSAYEEAKGILQQSGYRLFERVLDASHCGVPQIRKRFFMFAWRTKEDVGARLDDWINESMTKTPLTVKQYLGDEIDIDFYYRHPRNYSRRAIFTVREPSPTIRGVNRPVPPNYQRTHLDSAPPAEVRSLTSLERSRIQTFPSAWKWSKDNGETLTKSDLEVLIGNAVPVNLAKFVGKGLLHATG